MSAASPSFDQDLDSFNQNIDGVSEGVHDFLWKRHRGLMIAAWTLTVLFEAFILLGMFSLNGTSFGMLYAYGLFLPFLIPIAIYIHTTNRMRGLFFAQLAEALGLTYASTAHTDSVTGHLFSIGDLDSIRDVLSGTYRGYPLRLFSYVFDTGSGKSRQTHHFSVCELTLPAPAPEILVIGSDAPNAPVTWQPQGAKRLTLEGDFNKSFDVYVEVGKETDALQILEPDSMEALETRYLKYGFEYCGNRLNVFTYENALTKDAYADYLLCTDDLLDILIPETARMERADTMPALSS